MCLLGSRKIGWKLGLLCLVKSVEILFQYRLPRRIFYNGIHGIWVRLLSCGGVEERQSLKQGDSKYWRQLQSYTIRLSVFTRWCEI